MPNTFTPQNNHDLVDKNYVDGQLNGSSGEKGAVDEMALSAYRFRIISSGDDLATLANDIYNQFEDQIIFVYNTTAGPLTKNIQIDDLTTNSWTIPNGISRHIWQADNG
ncbi:MAG: hypothetical protein EBY39_04450, partial [Flavobacteriia bacterium]|nr:hypothetical protein [Flavobacteriia bacterium]